MMIYFEKILNCCVLFQCAQELIKSFAGRLSPHDEVEF